MSPQPPSTPINIFTRIFSHHAVLFITPRKTSVHSPKVLEVRSRMIVFAVLSRELVLRTPHPRARAANSTAHTCPHFYLLPASCSRERNHCVSTLRETCTKTLKPAAATIQQHFITFRVLYLGPLSSFVVALQFCFCHCQSAALKHIDIGSGASKHRHNYLHLSVSLLKVRHLEPVFCFKESLYSSTLQCLCCLNQ